MFSSSFSLILFCFSLGMSAALGLLGKAVAFGSDLKIYGLFTAIHVKRMSAHPEAAQAPRVCFCEFCAFCVHINKSPREKDLCVNSCPFVVKITHPW